MKFERLHKRVTYLVAFLGLSALSFGDTLRLPIFGAFMVLAAASWFVDEQRFLDERWTRAVNTLMVVLALGQLVRGFFFDTSILTLSVEFVGALQVSRLYHRRAALDHQHIAVLAVIHLLAATTLSTGLDYAVVFFAFIVVTPWILALNHLRSEIEMQHALPGAEITDGPSPAARRLLGSQLVGGGFLAATAALSVPLFAVTAIFFLLFPRVGLGFLQFGDGETTTMAGFGDDVELGGFGRIRDDPSIVMRVTPPELPEDPPARVALRMRGTSFDHYDGRRWSRTLDEEHEILDIGADYPLLRRRHETDLEFDIIVDPIDQPVVFLPQGTVAVRVPPRVSSSAERFWDLTWRDGLDVRYEGGDGRPFAYQAFVATPEGPPIRRRREILTDEKREAYLQLPGGYDRVRTLARTAAARGSANERDDDVGRAMRIEGFLRSTAFTYSLQQPDVGDEDPLEHFLFTARSGHCEYFSTAMAVMLRTLGIPARNVTGFVGGRFNTFGRYYGIRNGDAHSWVEAYVGGRWVAFDPTPPARAATGGSAEESWLTPVRQMLDALRTAWQRRIVGYDMQDQVEGLQAIFRWMRSGGGAGAAAEDTVAASRGRSRSMAVPLVLLLSLGLFAFALYRYFRGGSGDDLDAETARAVALYQDLERALDKRGASRPPSRTPRQHATALHQDQPELAEVAEEITEAYLAARYAGEGMSAERAKALRSRLGQLG